MSVMCVIDWACYIACNNSSVGGPYNSLFSKCFCSNKVTRYGRFVKPTLIKKVQFTIICYYVLMCDLLYAFVATACFHVFRALVGGGI